MQIYLIKTDFNEFQYICNWINLITWLNESICRISGAKSAKIIEHFIGLWNSLLNWIEAWFLGY